MKIHTNKFKDDFEYYFEDFEKSILRNINHHKSRDSNMDFFKIVYPLFVLLESLTNFEYFVDPSKKILISEYLTKNNKEQLIRIARTLSIKDDNSEVLRKGVMKSTFTPYFKELYSDSLLLLNQFYLNNYRGCYIYLRCIIEDLCRHLYYKDHREEFFMVDSDVTEYDVGLTPEKFRQYLSKTSFLSELKKVNEKFEIKNDEKQMDIFKLNEELYQKTSASVHASKETSMNKYSSNSELNYKESKALEIINVTRKVVNVSLVFLICGHIEQFSRFNEFEKTLILYNFGKKTKPNLRKFLNI